MRTLFTIAIPAYKRKFLKEAIDSCLSQTYNNWELVIVDDASPEDLNSIIIQYDDPRIRSYRNEKNCGAVDVVDNWNICLSYAKGDYIICMGDDDRLLPNCLYEYFKLIKKYPGIGILHGWTEIIDENSNVSTPTTHRCEFESAMSLAWHRWNAYNLQFIGDFCFNTEWLKKNGGFFKLPMAWGSDDISAIIGATKNGIANTQKVVFQYRVNNKTISKSGDPSVKMKSIILDYKWRKSFISQQSENEQDEIYRKNMLAIIDHIYDKKKAGMIASDMQSKSIFRIFFWIYQRKNYSLSIKSLALAVLLYCKSIL